MCVVGDDAPDVDDRRPDKGPIHLAAIREGGHVAWCDLEPADELLLQMTPAEVAQILQGHGRIFQNLSGFQR